MIYDIKVGNTLCYSLHLCCFIFHVGSLLSLCGVYLFYSLLVFLLLCLSVFLGIIWHEYINFVLLWSAAVLNFESPTVLLLLLCAVALSAGQFNPAVIHTDWQAGGGTWRITGSHRVSVSQQMDYRKWVCLQSPIYSYLYVTDDFIRFNQTAGSSCSSLQRAEESMLWTICVSVDHCGQQISPVSFTTTDCLYSYIKTHLLDSDWSINKNTQEYFTSYDTETGLISHNFSLMYSTSFYRLMINQSQSNSRCLMNVVE